MAILRVAKDSLTIHSIHNQNCGNSRLCRRSKLPASSTVMPHSAATVKTVFPYNTPSVIAFRRVRSLENNSLHFLTP